MVILTKRPDTVNLKLFLETLGFEVYIYRCYEDTDEILVISEERLEFLEAVKSYVERFGYTPYHLALSPRINGERVEGDKVSFKSQVTQMVEFPSITGVFTLVLMETEDTNYLWKTYTSPQLIPFREYSVTGKMKAVITGLKGEVLNLVSHLRLK